MNCPHCKKIYVADKFNCSCGISTITINNLIEFRYCISNYVIYVSDEKTYIYDMFDYNTIILPSRRFNLTKEDIIKFKYLK